jgi:hypothetical protein
VGSTAVKPACLSPENRSLRSKASSEMKGVRSSRRTEPAILHDRLSDEVENLGPGKKPRTTDRIRRQIRMAGLNGSSLYSTAGATFGR